VRKTASASEVHVSLLGEFSVTTGGQPVEDHWRLRKAKTLVKMLALAPGHRLHRDAIAEILWPDAELETAANNLYQILHTIRRMIGATSIALNDDVVRLCPAGGLSVDVDLFDQAAAIARRNSNITALQHALQLWTGSLLPEDQYAEWTLEHRERLSETHAAVASLLGSKLLEQGEQEAALALVEPLAAARPLDENLNRVLIDVLAGLGRRWEAIEAWRTAAPRARRGVRRRARTPNQSPSPAAAYRPTEASGAQHATACGAPVGMEAAGLSLAARKGWRIASVIDLRRGRHRQDAPG